MAEVASAMRDFRLGTSVCAPRCVRVLVVVVMGTSSKGARILPLTRGGICDVHHRHMFTPSRIDARLFPGENANIPSESRYNLQRVYMRGDPCPHTTTSDTTATNPLKQFLPSRSMTRTKSPAPTVGVRTWNRK